MQVTAEMDGTEVGREESGLRSEGKSHLGIMIWMSDCIYL